MSLSNERFQELFERYIDSTLTESEAAELLAAFSDDRSVKEQFVDEVVTANSLFGLSAESVSETVVESIRLGADCPEFSESVLKELKAAEQKIVRFPAAGVVTGLAAVIAIGLIVFSILRPTSNFATLAQSVDAEWESGSLLQTGDGLGKGILRLAAGVARLDFADGVRLSLTGPAVIELLSPGQTLLHSGSLTAHVPITGIGFQVHTASAEIVDLGTTFGVSVDQHGETDVTVFEGEVEVKSLANREGKIIKEGVRVKLKKYSRTFEPEAFEPIGFRPGWSVLFGVKNTGGQVRFVNAQPVRNPIEVEDRENIIIFPERFGKNHRRPVEVTFSDPGNYVIGKSGEQRTELSLKDQRIDIYLLQYNPPYVEGIPVSDQVKFSGEVTFDRPILGVIALTDQLIKSDLVLGKKRFDYPTNPLRGLEAGESITISEDRYTLKVDWQVMQALKRGGDQIRVITASHSK